MSALKYQSIEEVINDVLDLKDNLQREHPEIAMQSDYGIWEKMPRDNEQITWAQRKEVVTLVRGKVKHVLSIYQDQYIAKEKNMNTRYSHAVGRMITQHEQKNALIHDDPVMP